MDKNILCNQCGKNRIDTARKRCEVCDKKWERIDGRVSNLRVDAMNNRVVLKEKSGEVYVPGQGSMNYEEYLNYLKNRSDFERKNK